MRKHVLACIDGSPYAAGVADHAGWAAKRLGRPVELLQVLGRREAVSDDRSGRIVAGARRALLEELTALDAERARLLQKQARLDLDDARARVEAAGVTEVDTVLRHGDLLEELAAREPEADLVVVGKRGEAADFAQQHLGSNLERIVRASHLPVLIASRSAQPIRRFLVAFDGRASARRALETIASSNLLEGLSGLVVTVGPETRAGQEKLEIAAQELRDSGYEASARFEPGQPDEVIPRLIEREGVDLLVMGAYAHSRLRSLVIGSTTSAMIRACAVPILVYRS